MQRLRTILGLTRDARGVRLPIHSHVAPDPVTGTLVMRAASSHRHSANLQTCATYFAKFLLSRNRSRFTVIEILLGIIRTVNFRDSKKCFAKAPELLLIRSDREYFANQPKEPAPVGSKFAQLSRDTQKNSFEWPSCKGSLTHF